MENGSSRSLGSTNGSQRWTRCPCARVLQCWRVTVLICTPSSGNSWPSRRWRWRCSCRAASCLEPAGRQYAALREPPRHRSLAGQRSGSHSMSGSRGIGPQQRPSWRDSRSRHPQFHLGERAGKPTSVEVAEQQLSRVSSANAGLEGSVRNALLPAGSPDAPPAAAQFACCGEASMARMQRGGQSASDRFKIIRS